MPDMGDHFMADHIEHDEDFNWNEDVKPLWKPQEISAGEYVVNIVNIYYIVNTVHMLCRIINIASLQFTGRIKLKLKEIRKSYYYLIFTLFMTL